MRKMSKRRKGNQPERSATQLEEQTPKKACSPLGKFCEIPTEMIVNILHYLPFHSIANLALTSREWQGFLENWMESTNAKHLIARRIGEGSNKNKPKKTRILTFSGLGSLVKHATMFSPPKRRTRSRFNMLRYLMTEINLAYTAAEQANAMNLRAFGAFLAKSLKSSSEEDSVAVIDAVLRRSRARLCLSTILRQPTGKRQSHEFRLRTLIREVFQSRDLLTHAVKLLAEKLNPPDTARFAFVLWGPCINGVIRWNAFCSAGQMELFEEFGELLSFCWRRKLLDVESLIPCLRSGPFWWREDYVASLYSLLDMDVAVSLLTAYHTRMTGRRVLDSPSLNLLVAISVVKDELLWKTFEDLKKVVSKRDYAKLMQNMLRALNLKINIHKGDHDWCMDCPLDKLATMKQILET